jgi:hypothetical protein
LRAASCTSGPIKFQLHLYEPRGRVRDCHSKIRYHGVGQAYACDLTTSLLAELSESAAAALFYGGAPRNRLLHRWTADAPYRFVMITRAYGLRGAS